MFVRDLELELITALCRELAKLGLNVAMSDARPAAVIHGHARLSVTVDDVAECFVWSDSRGRYRHPAADPAGAARLIGYASSPAVLQEEGSHDRA